MGNADETVFDLTNLFAHTTCNGPWPLGEGIDIYFAGGCSADGTFFYGEQCGGSTFGPFSHLSNHTYLGYGACEQPDMLCECNAYVETSEGGCWNIGTPPGSGARYFLQVNDPVCMATEEPMEMCEYIKADTVEFLRESGWDPI